MEIEPVTLAYLAGIIDADGYITVQRSLHKGRRYYGAKIGIAGTRREPHDLAASLWGGKVGLYEPRNPHHRGQFQWSRSGRAAAQIIALLMPYLRIKRDQALTALQLDEHLERGRGDDPYPEFGPHYDPAQQLEELSDEAKGLNLRGKKAAGRQLDGRTHDAMPELR